MAMDDLPIVILATVDLGATQHTQGRLSINSALHAFEINRAGEFVTNNREDVLYAPVSGTDTPARPVQPWPDL
jgi:hypothetical protein